MKNLIAILILAVCLTNCSKTTQTEQTISQIHLELDFVPFHHEFFSANKQSLQDIKQKYPYLFPTEIEDSHWLSMLNDSEEKLLYQMADSVFGDLKNEKTAITSLYKHLRYYQPDFTPPKTFSVIGGLDYEHPVIYADTLVFVSLDMFLGANSEVYNSFPQYIANNYTPEHLIVALANALIDVEFPTKNGRSFIESMLYYGKKLYLLELLLPNCPEHIRLGYAKEKMQWSIENERQIWSYFITEDMLYRTDSSLQNRFLNTAPFSKFYYDFDVESPGGIGQWVGYKIVRSYMKNNKTSLTNMLSLDAETLFRKSKYKPEK